MKKILCVLLIVLMCLTAMPLGGFAELDFGITASALNATGKCGKTAIYTFDSATGELIISGTGAIAAEAFYKNKEIKNVIIGDGITEIGTDVFNSSSIESIAIGKDVTVIGDKTFCECDNLTSIAIPDSVTTIGESVFAGCYSLTNATIGDSVTIIGYSAFAYCNNLTKVTIGDSATTVGVYAFLGCDNLTIVNIPDAVTTIDDSAFYNCTSLESINLPKSVTHIGYAAFRYCSSLYDVYYEGSEEEWNAIEIGENNTGLDNATIHFGEVVPECQHEYVWVAGILSTCINLGMRGHYQCQKCGKCFDASKTEVTLDYLKKELDPTNHEGFTTEIEGTKIPSTCVAKGEVMMECACGAREKKTLVIDPTAHSFTETIHKILPTCVSEGKETKKCICGAEKTEVIPTNNNHDWGAFTEIKAPTCTEMGIKERACKREGCTAKDMVEIILATEHTYSEEKVITITPTCTSEGEKAIVCINCGEKKSGSEEVIPATVHDWNLSEIKKKATCTAEGVLINKCIYCKETKEEIIPATSHDYWDLESKEATCTEDGYCVWQCSACKHTYTETIPATGHSYPDNWSIIIAPDCQNTGFAVKVCFSCHDVIAQKVPKAGHADLDGDSKCDTCEMIIVVEPEEPTDPDTPNEPEEKPCDCDCHAGGIKAFFFKLINFFAKIFDKSARVCKCGASH